MVETRNSTLSDGRKISLREPGPDQMLDLILGVGAEAAMNPTWMNYAVHAASVVELDGQPLAFPMDEAAVKNVLRKLGSKGFSEVFLLNTKAAPDAGGQDAVKN